MAVDPSELIVSPADVAAAYQLVNPSQAQLDSIADAIADAQADVEGFLNRPLVPTEVAIAGLYPVLDVDLDSYRAWPQVVEQFDDDVTVKARTANPDGTYDVVFLIGLDGANTRPIARYVKAHAVRTLREDESYGFPLNRVVTSLSAEGQSIQFVARPSDDGSAGSLPKLPSLRQYRRRAAFTRDRGAVFLWPNSGASYLRSR